MCGIVGYISKHQSAFSSERQQFLAQGLVLDTLRGWDSTGLIHIHNDFDVKTLRSIQNGPQFVRSKKYLETDTDGWAAIGHNRAATLGSIKQANAHPFKFGPVAMVHNGSVHNMGENLPFSDHKAAADQEVDSAVIAYNLSQAEPDEAHEVISKIRGAYTLVWTDERDESINFVRNRHRPLIFGTNRAQTMLYFMSEAGMLHALSERMRASHAKVTQMFELEVHKHVKFYKNNLVPEVATIVPFQYPTYSPAATRGPQTSQNATRRNAAHDENWESACQRIKEAAEKSGKSTQTSSKTSTTTHTGATSEVGKIHDITRGGSICPNPVMQKAVRSLYQLDGNDKVRFKPKRFEDWGNSRGCVVGVFIHHGWGDTEWEAIIPHFPKNWMAEQRMTGNWTVVPVGLAPTRMENKSKDGMPAMMCSVSSFTCDIPPADDAHDTDLSEQREDDVEEMLGKELFYGPNNSLIPRDKWDALTAYGCTFCSAPFDDVDHAEVLWVGERDDQPLCGSCQRGASSGDPDAPAINWMN